MKDAIKNAKLELGRADHLVLVSLKYTRTVDIFRNAIARMISAYEWMISALIKCLEKRFKNGVDQEHKDLSDLGDIDLNKLTPIEKAKLIIKHFKDDEVKKNISLYLNLRKILTTSYQALNEYRRYVTMKTFVENKEVNIDIDTINEYYLMEKQFLEKVETIIKEC